MSQIRLITSSDEHVCDQVGFRKDDYKSAILNKLIWQGTMASKFNATALIRGGDFFHVKTANRTSMSTLIDVMSIHRSYFCPTYSIVGNHDIVYNDISTLSKQPLGVLFESGVFNRLTEKVFESGSMSVRVVGVDYSTDMNAKTLSDLVKSKGHNYNVAIVHALAEMEPSAKIQSFFNEEVMDYRDLVFPGCPDVYVFGHYHKDQGIQEHLGVKFVNLGSIARGSLTLENIERKPKIAMMSFSSSGISIEEKIIPHEDPSKIFDFERKKSVENNRQSMGLFLEKLRSNASMVNGFSVQQRMSKFMDSKDFSSEEKEIVKEVFEAAETGSWD